MPIFIADSVYIRPRPIVRLSGSITDQTFVHAALDNDAHILLSSFIGTTERVAASAGIGLQFVSALSMQDRVSATITVIGSGSYAASITTTDKVAVVATLAKSPHAAIAKRTNVFADATIMTSGISLSSNITTKEVIFSDIIIVEESMEIQRAVIGSDITVTTTQGPISGTTIGPIHIGTRPVLLEFVCNAMQSSVDQFIFVSFHYGASAGFTPDTTTYTDTIAAAMKDIARITVATKRNDLIIKRVIDTSDLTAGDYYFKVSSFGESANITLKAVDGKNGNYSPVYFRAVQE